MNLTDRCRYIDRSMSIYTRIYRHRGRNSTVAGKFIFKSIQLKEAQKFGFTTYRSRAITVFVCVCQGLAMKHVTEVEGWEGV